MCRKVSKLNNDFKFIWDYEKNERVYENSLKKEYFNKGIEQGVEKGVKDTAINMLKKKIDINFISEVTELDLESIKKLQEELNL